MWLPTMAALRRSGSYFFTMTTTKKEDRITGYDTPLAPRAAALLAQLEALTLSAPDDPLGFECRLADDNGWTLGHALDVVREYRRFLVLTQVAGEPVCPSDDVDQAWHLHITRTADYARLCAALPGGFLHHTPSRGGASEFERHRAMYERTLERYRAAFGRRPPPAVWPDVGDRFGAPASPPMEPGWRVPAFLRQERTLVFATFIVAGLAGLLAEETGLANGLVGISGPGFLAIGALLFAFAAWIGLRTPRAARPGRRDRLDPYEAAWLAGGLPRLCGTTVSLLVARGRLRWDAAPADGPGAPFARWIVVPDARPVEHPAERAALEAARDGLLSLEQATDAARPFAAASERRLQAAGLAADAGRLARRQALGLLVACAALALMVARLLQGLQRERPILFLVIEIAAMALLVFVLASARRRATGRGELALQRLRERVDEARPTPGDRAGASSLGLVGLGFSLALLGSAAVAGDARFTGLEYAFGRVPPGTASGGGDGSSGGSGCGASGCGGGGGCGGCGGGD